VEVTVDSLFSYIRNHLENQAGIVASVDQMLLDRISTASRREEIFNREFLSPTIADFFYEEARDALDLTDSEIRCGLGTEGSHNMPKFGFSPGLGRDFFFNKTDVLQSSAPAGWLDQTRLTGYRPCPDFQIRPPLPLSLVGELKYATRRLGAATAVNSIYDAVRQGVFYMGAFGGSCEAAVIIADATDAHDLANAFEGMPTRLKDRFNGDNRLHLLVLRLL
jgi:hypothetical protein